MKYPMSNTTDAMNLLTTHKKDLTPPQYRTIRGQIRSGNEEGAIKGLQRLLRKKVSA